MSTGGRRPQPGPEWRVTGLSPGVKGAAICAAKALGVTVGRLGAVILEDMARDGAGELSAERLRAAYIEAQSRQIRRGAA